MTDSSSSKCVVCSNTTTIYDKSYKKDRLCSIGCYMKYNNIETPQSPITFNLQNETELNEKTLDIGFTNMLQIGFISLNPNGGIIPKEIHQSDQLIQVIRGEATITTYDREGVNIVDRYFIGESNKRNTIIIPAFTFHQLENLGDDKLKAFTVYAPKAH